MADQDAILDKIVKLLALADGSSGPESEVAAERAAELMTKYQIEEAQVLSRSTTPDIVVVVERIDDLPEAPRPKRLNNWKSLLANCIVCAMNGRMFTRKYPAQEYTFMMVGGASAINSARYMYMMLVRELERRVRRYLRETNGKGPQGNAFLQGAAMRIYHKMIEGRDRVLAGAESTALAVFNKTVKKAEDTVAQMGLKQRREAPALRDESARIDGWINAADIDVQSKNPGLEEPDKELT